MATATLALADFLLARIAEDEELARTFKSRGVLVLDAVLGSEPVPIYYTARVLAECEAKRRIVEEFAPCVDDGDGYAAASRYALSVLASVYADHPDYREEWRP